MIALSTDWVGLGILGLVFFGGTIAAFFSRLGDILMAFAGVPREKKLSKAERQEIEQLRIENGQLREVLREVQAYDKFAATPLTTELSDKVNQALAPRPQLRGRP